MLTVEMKIAYKLPLLSIQPLPQLFLGTAAPFLWEWLKLPVVAASFLT